MDARGSGSIGSIGIDCVYVGTVCVSVSTAYVSAAGGRRVSGAWETSITGFISNHAAACCFFGTVSVSDVITGAVYGFACAVYVASIDKGSKTSFMGLTPDPALWSKGLGPNGLRVSLCFQVGRCSKSGLWPTCTTCLSPQTGSSSEPPSLLRETHEINSSTPLCSDLNPA